MGRPCAALVATIPILSFFAAQGSCLNASKTAPGEVIVVMTTDMKNIDMVQYTVSIGDPEIDAGSNTFDASDLPATLGIASGSQPTGPVHIHVEARGPDGSPLVVRDASLTAMPAAGVKRLSMPLDWLCSSEASPPTCPVGQTCRAGGCSAEAFAIDGSTLPDYVASESTDCTGALDYCFASAALALPKLDLLGNCTVPTPTTTVSQLNVALKLVDGSNYAPACTPLGCLIPVDQDPLEGWKAVLGPMPGGTGAISLPRAVCDDVASGKILGVAMTTACATKSPLCPPSQGGCIASRPGCPGYLGYACSGSVTPPLTASEVTKCWMPSITRGQDLCCIVNPGGTTLIDDMSDSQIQLSPPAGDAPGQWFTRVVVDASSPKSMAFVDNTPGARCIDSNGSDHPILEEFDLGESPDGGLAQSPDAPKSAGISFWAFSPYDGQRFRVGFRTANPSQDNPSQDVEIESTKLTCNAAACDALHNRWVRYIAKWPVSAQGPFDPTSFVGAYFAADSRVFDFCVSQIYFTQ